MEIYKRENLFFHDFLTLHIPYTCSDFHIEKIDGLNSFKVNFVCPSIISFSLKRFPMDFMNKIDV